MNHQVIFHRLPHRAFAFLTCRQQAFHGHVAPAARRHIGNTQQAGVVVWINHGFHVGEKIPYLAPIKKALAADQIISHLRLAQRRLQRPGLDVRAKENGVFLPRNPFAHTVEFNLPHNRLGLLFLILKRL